MSLEPGCGAALADVVRLQVKALRLPAGGGGDRRPHRRQRHSPQANLHRISHGDVTGQLLRAGFVLKEMILIESEYDDRRFNVFRPGVRGRTDRFIATLEKPKS